MNTSRRFFLGGAISLIAASTFTPSIANISNMPTIYGTGDKDDTDGIGALFRNEPVIFSKDQIGVDKHEGLFFHKGKFVVCNTIHVPAETKIEFEGVEFIGYKLPDGFPFFHCELPQDIAQFAKHGVGVQISFSIKRGHKGRFVTYRGDTVKYQ